MATTTPGVQAKYKFNLTREQYRFVERLWVDNRPNSKAFRKQVCERLVGRSKTTTLLLAGGAR